jgi:Tol biopolymer transport system component
MDYPLAPTPPPGLDHAPSWNPSGDELAFWREESGGRSLIKAVKIATKVEREITHPGANESDGWPSWSPDGVLIAFWRQTGFAGDAIWSMPSNGLGTATNVSRPDTAHGVVDRTPCWSPDGAEIAFARATWVDWDIWIMSANGSGQRKTSTPAARGNVDFYPSWQNYK